MKRLLTFCITLVLFASFTGTEITTAQTNGKILDRLAADARFSTMAALVKTANLTELLNGWGPITVFVPTNEAFNALPASVRQQLAGNEGQARQTALNLIAPGKSLTSQQLWSQSDVRMASGGSLTLDRQSDGLYLNGEARIIQYGLTADNGVIHVIDAVITPATATGGGDNAPAGDPNAPPSPSDAFLGSPAGNPAYVPGGYMPYWEGVRKVSYNDCRGMSWTLLEQHDGVAKVGADRQTNPYRGDTACGEELPVLCLKTDYRQPPISEANDKWGQAQIRVTAPVPGFQLTSKGQADRMCQQNFGGGWRMANFHEGGGRYFWAFGGIPLNVRFWVMIGDQPANPWNQAAITAVPNSVANGPIIKEPFQNPAYVPGGRMDIWRGQRAGRGQCKGMTWTVLQQEASFVRVGADGKTNPYRGDTLCEESLPALCIKVNNYPAPASRYNMDFTRNWSGGEVKATWPTKGIWMTTLEQANKVCENAFGAGWQLAEHHDGSYYNLGPIPGGWEVWAYGGLPIDTRFWVAIGNQPANPWNGWGRNAP